MAAPPRLVVVTGGARSGKSEVAEALAGGSGEPVTYVATGHAGRGDADFDARVAAHRRRRPPGWATVEAAGDDLVGLLARLEGTVLVDSVGTWVAGTWEGTTFAADGTALARAASGRPGTTVLVTDEVGWGVHPSSEAGRRFRDALGEVNLALSRAAHEVLLVVAGRALRLPPPG